MSPSWNSRYPARDRPHSLPFLTSVISFLPCLRESSWPEKIGTVCQPSHCHEEEYTKVITFMDDLPVFPSEHANLAISPDHSIAYPTSSHHLCVFALQANSEDLLHNSFPENASLDERGQESRHLRPDGVYESVDDSFQVQRYGRGVCKGLHRSGSLDRESDDIPARILF